jgi:flavin-dependent thymidylate synthase
MTIDQNNPILPALPSELRDSVQVNAAGFPLIPSPAFATAAGTPYLRTPGVALLARPQVAVDNLADFLGGFAPDLRFMQYLDDPTLLSPASQLCKTAGQLCYASFAPKRTLNADADRYFYNIKESGHGSVLEHASFTFLFYGVSRSLTHELIRHRAGFSYCLAGHTHIYAEDRNNRLSRHLRKWTIEELYLLTQSNHGRSRLGRIRLRCLDESTNSFTRNRIKTVICSGVKPVFRVELEDGKTITCSKDHRFLTPDGWRPLEEIVGGVDVTQSGIAVHGPLNATISVNGVYAYRDSDWLKTKYLDENRSISEICQIANVSATTLKQWLRRFNLSKEPDVVQLGRQQTEIPPDVALPKGRGRLLIPRVRRIKQVTYAGEQMTYDIEMEAPHHNFVAEGIITHNSQVSQRYVSGRVLRFVERPEYAVDPELHAAFERRIDRSAAEYEQVAQRLLAQQKEGAELLSADAKTDLRKKVQQAARSLLPNETEAPIVMTGNVRAWRHFLEMRASAHAEIEIRALAFAVYLCLVTVEPLLFADYRIVTLPDSTYAVETELMKV